MRYVLGLALAIAVGIPLGLAAGWYRRFSYAVEPLLSALNATPQVAFLPLLVIWVGTGFATRVLIIFLLAVLPIAINAQAAVRTTDPRLIKVAASFGASDWRLFRTIILPSAIPFLLAGLRLAIGRGMIGIVVGEIYGSAAGVGAMISQAGSRFQTDRVFVGVLTIVAAGDDPGRARAADRAPRRGLAPAGMTGKDAPDTTDAAKLEAQDIRLEYFQPRTNTRLTALDGVEPHDHRTANSSRSWGLPAAARPRSSRWSTG